MGVSSDHAADVGATSKPKRPRRPTTKLDLHLPILQAVAGAVERLSFDEGKRLLRQWMIAGDENVRSATTDAKPAREKASGRKRVEHLEGVLLPTDYPINAELRRIRAKSESSVTAYLLMCLCMGFVTSRGKLPEVLAPEEPAQREFGELSDNNHEQPRAIPLEAQQPRLEMAGEKSEAAQAQGLDPCLLAILREHPMDV